MHEVALEPVWKVPGAHSVQLFAWPAFAAKLPGAHCVHERLPAAETEPAGQMLQMELEVCPGADVVANVPAAHGVHAAEPGATE